MNVKNIKTICCIGAGYVGGPTMAVIADNCPHINVNVVDVNEERIQLWNCKDLSKLPIFEPGLSDIVGRVRGRNLFFSTDIESSIKNADMVFISVNTPTKIKGIGAGKASDISWVEECTRQVAKYSVGETIVVEKSTIPVKTAEAVKSILSSSDSEKGSSFSVLSNPEFLAEGTAINDLQNPDRILIGGEHSSSIEALKNIYLNWVNQDKIISTNLWSSELSKLTANAFLAQRISSINSISALCEVTGANIDEVKRAIGLDKRIGDKFLNAGPGFGGSCFKKDILNLTYLCEHFGLPVVSNYWEHVISMNDWQNYRIYKMVIDKLFGNVSKKKIVILGFSFKANTNDTRESPAISICKNLLNEGAFLSIHDPQVNRIQVTSDLGDIGEENNSNWSFSNDLEDIFDNADAIVVLTEWDIYKKIDWNSVNLKLRKPAWLFDTRKIINPEKINNCDLNFWQVGLGNNIL
tara:strand:+ start:175 stop:1572 length:1398 start_codon:yes stop_codon:yes gene_type:complete